MRTNAFLYVSKMYFIKGKSKLMLSNYIIQKHISTSSLWRIILHASTVSWLKEKTAVAAWESEVPCGIASAYSNNQCWSRYSNTSMRHASYKGNQLCNLSSSPAERPAPLDNSPSSVALFLRKSSLCDQAWRLQMSLIHEQYSTLQRKRKKQLS